MKGINKAILVGHLGKDPEFRTLDGGSSVATFPLATSESWTDKHGNKQEATEWHRINTWGKLAEIADQYLRKGSLVYIEGKIKTRKWTDQNNVERYTTEITASTLTMLDRKPESEYSRSHPQGHSTTETADDHPTGSGDFIVGDDGGDDLPF